MTAADLIRTHGLKPNDLVVLAGAGRTDVLAELRRLGCRVLAVTPTGRVTDPAIDTLRATLTPALARLIRDRYGPARLLLADAGVPPDVRALCLTPDGAAVSGDPPIAPLARAA